MRRQGRKGDLDPFSVNSINSHSGDIKVKDQVDNDQTKPEEEIEASNSQIEETTTAAVKGPSRILIFLKFYKQPIMFDQSVLKFDLEKEVGGDVTVFVNQDQYVINEIVQGNQKSIILNLSLGQKNKDITGAVLKGRNTSKRASNTKSDCQLTS